MEFDYRFSYLRKTEPRGKILFNILKPYLREGDRILDVNCGFSPLASHLLKAGFRVTGFDIHIEIVKHLKKKFSKGCWLNISLEKHLKEYFEVIIILGINALSFTELLSHHQPRLVLLEVVEAEQRYPCHDRYKEAIKFLLENGYHQRKFGKYNAKLERGSARRFTLMEKI